LLSELNNDGGWYQHTFTLSGLFAHANISAADYMRLMLFVNATDASNDFSIYIGRVQAVRS